MIDLRKQVEDLKVQNGQHLAKAEKEASRAQDLQRDVYQWESIKAAIATSEGRLLTQVEGLASSTKSLVESLETTVQKHFDTIPSRSQISTTLSEQCEGVKDAFAKSVTENLRPEFSAIRGEIHSQVKDVTKILSSRVTGAQTELNQVMDQLQTSQKEANQVVLNSVHSLASRASFKPELRSQMDEVSSSICKSVSQSVAEA